MEVKKDEDKKNELNKTITHATKYRDYTHEAEVVKKENIYTFTESELKDLKYKERAYGSRKTRGYIHFCYKNYIYQTNLGGIIKFLEDFADFLRGANYIPNIYKWNLFDWLDKNNE